jgi:phosphoribosyl 1,2-cyclic phosphate phosphodiesterase
VKLRFLGTGTSFGVPQIGCRCDVCRSPDSRDKRTRTAALVETNGGTRILIDAPPELRLQLLAADVDAVDALFITHEHADHTHGLDDIRGLRSRFSAHMPIFGPPETLATLGRRFPYIFDQSMKPVPGTSKPEGRAQPMEPGERVIVGDATVEAVEVPHGPVRVFGYRIGPIGYVTDAKTVPPDGIAALRGVTVLVINALRRKTHPTHLSIGEAVAMAREIGARRTYLTHLTHDISHAVLASELPDGVEPAFDGLTVDAD